MKKLFPLTKCALFSYLTDPLFYAASILTVLTVAFRFFFSAHFFLTGTGSTDLRPFFNTIPSVSVITVPLLVFRLRDFVHDHSLALSDFKKFLALAAASLAAFVFPLVLLAAVPVCASFFGTIEIGSLASGYVAIILYGGAAVSLCFLCSAFFSSALSLLISFALLLFINTVHVIPLYVNLPSFLTFFLEKISFAWHFDAASKGIIDSRDLIFYLASALLMLLLCSAAESRSTGRRIRSLSVFFLSIIFVSLTIFFNRLYFRLDVTSTRTFSVSKTTKILTSSLEEPLRITYFRSKELKSRYPKSNDIAEYLKTFVRTSDNLTLHFETADSERLSKLGVQGQQIKSQSGTKTEYLTVYSTILLQYLGRSSVIPFALSTDSLEYDLTRRIQELVSEIQRDVYLVSGNGRSIADEYSYILYYLQTQGFVPHELNADLIEEQAVKNPKSQFIVFGSSALSYEQSQALKTVVEKGASAFIAASPYSAAVESDWNITENAGDTLLPVLNSWGFAFEKALVLDISCFPLALQSGEGSEAVYETVNYPLWLSILPQTEALSGLTMFWASPLALYEHTRPLLVTSQYAWLQNQSEGGKDLPFLINPFEIEKSAAEAKKIPSRYVVAAASDVYAVTVVSDQYFVHDLLTGFIASSQSADSRNFQFLTRELLKLRGEDSLADLLSKRSSDHSLYKIADSEQFAFLSKVSLSVVFIIIPSVILIFGLCTLIIRTRKNHALPHTEVSYD